jgi:hypothetical protein
MLGYSKEQYERKLAMLNTIRGTIIKSCDDDLWEAEQLLQQLDSRIWELQYELNELENTTP